MWITRNEVKKCNLVRLHPLPSARAATLLHGWTFRKTCDPNDEYIHLRITNIVVFSLFIFDKNFYYLFFKFYSTLNVHLMCLTLLVIYIQFNELIHKSKWYGWQRARLTDWRSQVQTQQKPRIFKIKKKLLQVNISRFRQPSTTDITK